MYWVLIAAAVVGVLAVCLLTRSAAVDSGASPRRATLAAAAVFAVVIAVLTVLYTVRPAVGLPVEGRIDSAAVLLIAIVIWLSSCAATAPATP